MSGCQGRKPKGSSIAESAHPERRFVTLALTTAWDDVILPETEKCCDHSTRRRHRDVPKRQEVDARTKDVQFVADRLKVGFLVPGRWRVYTKRTQSLPLYRGERG